MSEQTQEQTAPVTEPEATTEPDSKPKPTETVEFWKQKAREQEQRAKANAEAAKRLNEIEESQKTEAQKQAEALSQTQAEVAKWQKVAVGNHIKALAAQDFADPSDAASALDPAKYLDASGEIDEATITADLAALLERKPHWRRQEGSTGPRVPAPNPAQGSGVNGKATVDPASQFAAILSGQLK